MLLSYNPTISHIGQYWIVFGKVTEGGEFIFPVGILLVFLFFTSSHFLPLYSPLFPTKMKMAV